MPASKKGRETYEHKIAKMLKAKPAVERDNLIALLEKYRRGAVSRRDEEKLAAAGLIDVPDTGNAEKDEGGLPETDSLKALAACLSRHFAGRLTINISPESLCQWRRGRNLGPGIPLPPAKMTNRYDTPAWAEWIEQWILPKYNRGEADPSADEVFRQAEIKEAQGKIDSAELKRIELRVAQGKYQPVENFIAGLREVGALLNQQLIAGEKSLVTKLAQATGKPPNECETAAAEIIDGLRNHLAEALQQAANKTAL